VLLALSAHSRHLGTRKPPCQGPLGTQISKKSGSTATPNRHRFQDSFYDRFFGASKPIFTVSKPNLGSTWLPRRVPPGGPSTHFFRFSPRHRFWIVLGSILGVVWTRFWSFLASNLNSSGLLWAAHLKYTGALSTSTYDRFLDASKPILDVIKPNSKPTWFPQGNLPGAT